MNENNNKMEMTEGQREIARNGYLMSLAVFITTMPIPIINLLSNLFFWMSHRKEKYELRWHCLNSFVSQIPLFFINSGAWYLGWNILWEDIELNNFAIGYFLMVAILNIAEIIMSSIASAKVYSGKEVNWLGISPFTHLVCPKVSWDKWKHNWVPAESKFFDMKEESKPKFIRDLAISLAGISLIFVFAYIVNIKNVIGDSKPSFISLIEESINHNIENKKYKNSESDKKLKEMSQTLISSNNIDSVNIFLIKKSEVNAFAYCRRNIAVQSKLIETCDTYEELMGVIAHEMSHIELNHVSDGARESIGVSILAAALLGDASNIVSTLINNQFSRTDEEAADKRAVDLLYNSGINPDGLVSFMEKLLTEYGDTSNSLITLLSTHPSTGDRVKYLKEYISKLKPKEYKTSMSEDEWKLFQKMVKDEGNEL